MEEIKEGYKVVFEASKDIYTSAFSEGFVRQYKINIWTFPRPCDGPLAVFNNFNDAVNLIKSTDNIAAERKIFRCLYKLSQHKHLWVENEKSMIDIYPTGTVFASSVMITEEINYRDKKDND